MPLKFITNIRDPVHGIIPITAIEKQIINSESFTRLLHIKQMGLTYLIFPGAKHSRYEHSIGVMHIADQMASAIRKVIIGKSEKEFNISDADLQVIRLAGLLHDIGHPPLSHALEEVLKHYPEFIPKSLGEDYSHESYSHKIILGDEISKILNRSLTYLTMKNIPEYIADIAIGKSDSPLTAIISGELDADRIDYLLRDSYYTGLPYGSIDLMTLINGLSIIQNEDDRYSLLYDGASIPAAEGILSMRYHLISSVHHHPDNLKINLMLEDGIVKYLSSIQRKFMSDPDGWEGIIDRLHIKLNDHELFAEMNDLIIDIFRRDYWEELCRINHLKMSPKDAYKIYRISNHSKDLKFLRLQLKNYYKINLNPEIHYVNAPYLNTKIHVYPFVYPRDLIGISPLCMGVVESSFIKLLLSIYSREIPRIKIEDSTIYEIINGVTENSYDNSRFLGLDLLLITLDNIFKVGKDIAGHDVLIKGDRKAIDFIEKYVLKELSSKYKFNYSANKEKLIGQIEYDLNLLTCFGLVYEKRKIISLVNKKITLEPVYQARIERKLSGWGIQTIKELKNYENFKELYKQVLNIINRVLTRFSSEYLELWDLYNQRKELNTQIAKLDEIRDRAEIDRLINHISKIREKIDNKKGKIPIFIK